MSIDGEGQPTTGLIAGAVAINAHLLDAMRDWASAEQALTDSPAVDSSPSDPVVPAGALFGPPIPLAMLLRRPRTGHPDLDGDRSGPGHRAGQAGRVSAGSPAPGPVSPGQGRPVTPPATVGDALRSATARLAAASLDTPRLDAEVLLRHVLGWDRTALFLHAPEAIGPADLTAFDDLLRRRLAGLPVAYLTGHRAFLGLDLLVTEAVLVPRPETELLVEWARDWLARYVGERPVVVDVGTGSGAISLGLASLLAPDWNGSILGIDVAPEALSVAIANRDLIGAGTPGPGVVGRVTFSGGSLLDGQAGPVDLILANLPYLTPEQVDGNPDLGAEPRLALDGGPDGLNLIRLLVGQAVTLLAPHGAIALELDPTQAAGVATLLRAAFAAAHIGILRDLAGHDRFVVADLSRDAAR